MMKLWTLLFAVTLASLGCANKPLIADKDLPNSRVEIDYVLGHSHYQYIAAAGDKDAKVSSQKDGKVLESRVISLARYQEFVSKVEDALKSVTIRDTAGECRTPYRVSIYAGDREKVASGCRSKENDSLIGQVIKEGEFLFYSEEEQTIQ